MPWPRQSGVGGIAPVGSNASSALATDTDAKWPDLLIRALLSDGAPISRRLRGLLGVSGSPHNDPFAQSLPSPNLFPAEFQVADRDLPFRLPLRRHFIIAQRANSGDEEINIAVFVRIANANEPCRYTPMKLSLSAA
jgi:hypothetical protein